MKLKREMWEEFGLVIKESKVEEHPVTAMAAKGEDMTALGVTSSLAASRLLNDPEKIIKLCVRRVGGRDGEGAHVPRTTRNSGSVFGPTGLRSKYGPGLVGGPGRSA